MTDIVETTADYEVWLGRAIPLIAADMAAKHQQLAASELKFLRGTYYYWLPSMARLLPELVASPCVALVGDLHVENFGTWRDRHGAQRWGINDFDELGFGPYAVDLVRLATSCLLVPHLGIDSNQLCQLLLDTWANAAPSHAVNLDGDNTHHLRHLLPAPKSATYYRELETGVEVPGDAIPVEVAAAAISSVDGWHPLWHPRQAGTGSLGHPRYVAVGNDGHGEPQAREAKLLGPPSASWAGLPGFRSDDGLYSRVQVLLRGPAPAFRVADWQVRRLAPDVVRIEIDGLHEHDEARVIASMAQALVNVHGVDASALASARTDSESRGRRWLAEAVEAMAADTHAAYQDWVSRT